jgi:hypothetical protein
MTLYRYHPSLARNGSELGMASHTLSPASDRLHLKSGQVPLNGVGDSVFGWFIACRDYVPLANHPHKRHASVGKHS